MKQIWDAGELSEHWSLSFDELELLKSKPARHHLAFCLQLKFYQLTGTFPRRRSDFSDTPLHFLADQLESDPEGITDYEWSGRTGRRHREEILTFLGIRKLNDKAREELDKWLIDVVYPQGLSPKEAIEHVYEWLRQHKIEIPAEKQLQRELATALSSFENDLFERLNLAILPRTKTFIDESLEAGSDIITGFNQLKADPGRLGLYTVLREIDKLNFIQSLVWPIGQLSKVNPKIKQRVASESAWEANGTQ